MLKKLLVLLCIFAVTPVYSARRIHSRKTEPASKNGEIHFVTKVEGYSRKKRPILSYRAGSGPRRVLYFGAFHGDEPQGRDLLFRLMDEIRKDPAHLDGRTVVLVPVVNPDGIVRGTRTNVKRVDLNRNFPTRDWSRKYRNRKFNPGTRKPEPETAAVIRLMKRFRPDAVVTIHAYLHCNNYDGPAEDLALAMAQYNHYAVKEYIGYGTPGSFGTWAGKEKKIPVITLELSRTTLEHSWTRQKDALVAALRYEPGQFDRGGIFVSSRTGDMSALRDALISGKKPADRDAAGWTPLHYAAFYGHADVIRELVAKGADVNAADFRGGTPLHFAAQNNRTNAVAVLLASGARPDARDAFGNTPLMEAGRNANLSPLMQLISAGADISARDNEGRPVIIDTARHGYFRTMKMLVENGADVNARDAGGRTPLMVAAEQDQDSMVRYLIEKGADVSARDNNGKTALAEARENGNRRMVAFLKRAGKLVKTQGGNADAGSGK